MNLTLKIWRPEKRGVTRLPRDARGPRPVSPDMSFLEMLDMVNERLHRRGHRNRLCSTAIAAKGICGTCSLVINGVPHGGRKGTTVCQLHMRHFQGRPDHHRRTVARGGRSRW